MPLGSSPPSRVNRVRVNRPANRALNSEWRTGTICGGNIPDRSWRIEHGFHQ
jgi:hypothetical protein